MFSSLLLHPYTKAELTALLNDTPHALLFVAPTGTGKLTVARAWAQQLADAANVSILAPEEGGSISIDAVRSLYKRTRSKQVGKQVVIIDHAETMGIEAQNAFLKLLEEPSKNVIFILLAPETEALLPTVLSRTQIIALQRVASDELAAYARVYAGELSGQELAQLLFIADGRPATLAAITQDARELERHVAIMQRAKLLLAASRYERLAQVQTMSKDRAQLIITLEAMARMLSLQLVRDPNARWQNLAQSLQLCLQRLRQNGNARAQLVHLFMAY